MNPFDNEDELNLNAKARLAKAMIATAIGFLAKEGAEKLFDIIAKKRLDK